MKNRQKIIENELCEKASSLTLSETLNRLMDESKIDGVQLSKKTGIPVTTINRLRKNDPNNNPTLTTLIPIANFFSLSLSQLVGDEPLPNSKMPGAYRLENSLLSSIPIIPWEEVEKLPNEIVATNYVTTEHEYSNQAYALIINEDNFENLLKGMILIADPKIEPTNRDYVVVLKDGQKIPTLKQLLFDDDQRYLKPLLKGYNILAFTPEYKILGVVMEIKKNMKKIL